jgi:hypothetical protein
MMASPAPNARFLDATQYSVSWFWKRLQADELDMQPPYQRNPVWQYQQKAFLIDSIINGYPVPEIYLQTTTSVEGDEVHTLVDGQQRIRACMEFLAGSFPLADYTSAYEGSYFNDLPDEVRGLIYRYKFVVRALPELTEAEVRDIFGRLNRNNVALNKQELRHSTYWGGFITAMELFSQRTFWVKSGLFTSNDFRRMLDIEFVSELVVAGLFGLQNKRGRLDYFYGLYENEFPEAEQAGATMDRVLGQLESLFEWPNTLRWGRKVDFYTLFAELWHRDTASDVTHLDISETSDRLIEFSREVTAALAYEEENERPDPFPSAVRMYARGVRNSSDLGSRRLRAQGLRSYVWGVEPSEGERLPVSEGDAHLARLPSEEELFHAAAEDDDDDRE